MGFRVSVLAAALLGAWMTAPGPVAAATLEEELANLLQEHPAIHKDEKSLESSAKEIDKSMAGFYPTVNVTADDGLEVNDDPSSRAAHPDKTFRRNATSASLTVTQNLFNGYGTTSAVDIARLNREVAEYTLEGTRQNTLFEGVKNYIDVLRQMRLVQLARSNESTIQTQLNLEDERVQRGSGIAVDVLQAKSRLQISKERRVNFEGTLEDAVSHYIQVFQRAPELSTMLDPVPPIELVPSEVETSISIALEENPAIAGATTAVASAEKKRKLAGADYFPQLDLVGRDGYEKNFGGELGTQRDYSVKARSTWNIFTGFSSEAAISQAMFDHGATKDNLLVVGRKVEEQVRTSWQALVTVRKRIELLENAVNIASEVFTARQQLREAGKETVLNVLDAESEVFNAQINFTSAAYDERLAVYQLLLSMGRLNANYLRLVAAN
jgi:adhesin transport system outer membrane protein